MREGVFMFKKVTSCAVFGIDGRLIGVEADVSDGLPLFAMVGYLSSSVKESSERVRTALRNSDIFLPPKRITINLTPANIRKDGSGFDLPIAATLLMCLGIEPEGSLDDTVIIGELGLDGLVRPVPGVLPMLCHCASQGFKACIVPYENVNEAMLIKGMKVFGIKSLDSLKNFFTGAAADFSGIGGTEFSVDDTNTSYKIDFSEIKGQETLKRGMELAAAGFHNVLMTGAAGAGKSMIAKRLPTIMPKLSFEESMDVTKIFSVNGLLMDNSRLVTQRPFRSPHHTISSRALVGGGSNPKPGEVSLAHNGVLFLDELPEFSKNTLEVLRQPIEDRKITISRVNATYVFPSDFMLVAAMNPCPCGHFPDRNKCSCSATEIKRYQGKISGPLLDRIDINMDVKPLDYEDLFEVHSSEPSSVIRARVERAQEIQKKRYSGEGIIFNSQLEGKLLKKHIRLNDECEEILKNTYKTTDLSARGVYRILRLARTVADLDGNAEISTTNLREAIFYRNSVSDGGENNV
jgi:magnesium chelatase family protein